MDQAPILYRIAPADLYAHLFEVTCTVADPNPHGHRFALPTWIPGSYLIREFARNVVSIEASSAGTSVPVEKINKSTWACGSSSGPLELRYRVYVWDLSVRGAHLDTTHGFFNGTSVFVQPLGMEGRMCAVDIEAPSDRRFADWRLATAMTAEGVDERGFGRYRAANYEELVDHPVEMGRFDLIRFNARGVQHDVAITGRQRADLDRLTEDLRVLCETQIDFFGAAPVDRYVFLVTALGEGYGGLEHRASTALMCRRDALPLRGRKEKSDAYREFLGLCSHEYFHTWNVKRIKPQAFTPYDLSREAYTRQLWAFEGITSYYDDLLLLRAGLIEVKDYLELLGRSLTRLLRTPGRLRQSVADSSFDAWIKFYRPDENTPNAVVSYYTKGGAVALALDLLLRRDTDGRASLDDVMRALWKEFGQGPGVPEGGVERMAAAVSGLNLEPFFSAAIHGTAELPLVEILRDFGVILEIRPAESDSDAGGKASGKDEDQLANRVTLGVKFAEGQEARISHVFAGGACERAGLAANDIVVAIDGLKATRANVSCLLDGRKVGESVRVHAFRRDELMEFDVKLQAAAKDSCVLTLTEKADEATLLRRQAWLGR